MCDTKSESSMFEVFASQISKGWCHYYVKIIRSGVLSNMHIVYVIFSCNNLVCSSMLWHVFEENKKY